MASIHRCLVVLVRCRLICSAPEELILSPDDGSLSKAEASRIAGSNDIGMVAWQCFMKTPEYPDGREIVLVGNDCTFMSGSFGVKEDDFYFAVSQYARTKEAFPVYIASNSGARIGLVEELKPYFKVAWNDASNPSLGFKYLYLSPDDFAAFPGTVNASEVIDDGETRMKLDDIIGQIHGIGVENLRGSGMIAGSSLLRMQMLSRYPISLGVLWELVHTCVDLVKETFR